MIITKQKDFNSILKMINNGSIFIVGCSECATLCHTGGEEEVLEMKKKLENEKLNVTGWVILDPACHYLNDKRILRKYQSEISNSDNILVLACGNGAQTVAEIVDNSNVIPGTDTLFLGEIKRLNDFEKRCDLCGECIQDEFGGFCPVARCPKSMLNGPCGGAVNGKCEINQELDCVWELIYNYLKKNQKLDQLKKIMEPKNWSKSNEYQRIC